MNPTLHVVLVEPEIPPNTGNVARLCLAVGARLHLVGPLGFSLDEKALRRAGMDYWKECDVRLWDSFETLRAEAGEGTRFWFFTTKAKRGLWEGVFQKGDWLVFGRESKGLPESLLHENVESCLRIPMRSEARSLNLATSVGIGVFEALRQITKSEKKYFRQPGKISALKRPETGVSRRGKGAVAQSGVDRF